MGTKIMTTEITVQKDIHSGMPKIVNRIRYGEDWAIAMVVGAAKEREHNDAHITTIQITRGDQIIFTYMNHPWEGAIAKGIIMEDTVSVRDPQHARTLITSFLREYNDLGWGE